MKLADLRSETKSTLVHFDAGDLKVEYRPNTVTADAVDQVNAALADPAKQTTGVLQLIGQMLASWDLEDDDGLVIPLDNPARLRAEVPMAVFGRIFTAVQDDQSPGEAAKR